MSWFAKKVIWIWTATESPFHSPHKLYGKIFQFGVTNQQYQFLRLLSQFSLHCYTRCYVVCQCGNCSLPSAISAKGLSPHPQSSGLTWPLQLTQGSSDMASASYTKNTGISPTVWLDSVSHHCESHNHCVLHKITTCTHRPFHYKSNNMFMDLTKWFRNYSRPIYKLCAPSNCR